MGCILLDDERIHRISIETDVSQMVYCTQMESCMGNGLCLLLALL